MSDPIASISSAIVTETELSDLIVRSKGFVEPGTSLSGRFSDEWRRTWIGLSPEDLDASIADEGEEYLSKVTTMLGGPPRANVVVEISRTEGSEGLPWSLRSCSAACGRRSWTIVEDTCSPRTTCYAAKLRARASGCLRQMHREPHRAAKAR